MTDIPDWVLKEAAKRCDWHPSKTLAQMRGYLSSSAAFTELCRAIEQHEAFKQKVSYAIEDVTDRDLPVAVLRRFVIEDDPLMDALTEAFNDGGVWEPCNKADADNLRAALEARGLEIRSKNDA
jgi:hypothetical protein